MAPARSRHALPMPTPATLAAFAACSCGDILHPWARDSCARGCLLCAVGTLQRAAPLYATLQLLA